MNGEKINNFDAHLQSSYIKVIKITQLVFLRHRRGKKFPSKYKYDKKNEHSYFSSLVVLRKILINYS